MKDKNKLIDHLAGRTARVFVVTRDGTDGLLADRIVLNGLPEAVNSNPELLSEIQRLACAAAGNRHFSVSEKPARVRNKIERLIGLMHDPDILDQLNLALSPHDAGRLIRKVEAAFGYRVQPRQSTAQAKKVSVGYTPPDLNPVQLAEAVADALRGHGVRVNTSKAGTLVRTLDAIKSATGFKTNSQESARIACGGTR